MIVADASLHFTQLTHIGTWYIIETDLKSQIKSDHDKWTRSWPAPPCDNMNVYYLLHSANKKKQTLYEASRSRDRAAIPKYVEKPFQSFLLQNQWTHYKETWHVASGTSITMCTYILTLC